MADFSARHIGPIGSDRQAMLDRLGYDTLDALTETVVPATIRSTEALPLPAARSEADVARRLTELAAMNTPARSMIGLGYHGTVTPSIIRRNVLEDPSWYTAYTPYQPEISQGRLEALLNFQTMIAELTGLPTAGASLLDEGTAVAEAMALSRRVTRKGSVFLVDAQALPQTIAVVTTRALATGVDVVVVEGSLVEALQTHEAFAVVVQVPGADGGIRPVSELRRIASTAHANGAQVIAAVDLLGLTLMTPPGEWGADMAVGSSQRFGVPLFYGGPHAGFISVRDGLERQLPGRLVGVSVDADGTAAFRLALQTREQHIRRDKATSNICTAQVLLAVAASMYAVYHGPGGLTGIARRLHHQTRRLAASIVAAGGRLSHHDFFDTLTVEVPGRAAEVLDEARGLGLLLRPIDRDRLGVSVGEDVTPGELELAAGVFGAAGLSAEGLGGLADHQREDGFLTHPVFNRHHSETGMLRYLRALSDRDFALDRGMIPLGSCTMKLNPTTAMEAISLPGFANLHPFAPIGHAAGYQQLIAELESWLCGVTGYDRVSLQPNAGSQGEFAGLMAVRSWHLANGDRQRTVCLIPSSAHGTNAASAVMAGMRVVVVKSAEDGSIDMHDLRAKIAANADTLAAIMVTYPSTHGVFEEGITELCALVHQAGGQVYVDGANLNALMGLALPGRFGADVSHLNLHKTFAIPHGGGGPGVGPVAVRAHLAPYLPNHPLLDEAGPATSYGPVSAAPFGSAGVLPISYAFIAMMGSEGLKEASQVAVLSANYIAQRLAPHFPILYTGSSNLVAHECIVDLRPLSKQTGVTVDDVAKRLIDYGFHAPTMSFPVAGTLMIEPTESESLVEVDRFCDAMIAIRAEADRVAAGEWPADNNPLRHAPHTLARVTATEWPHPYGREVAAFPAGRKLGAIGAGASDKYWPASARIDGAFGDRNLVCSCPPVDTYEG